MHQNAAIKKIYPSIYCHWHFYGEPQWTEIVRLNRKHTLYMYKAMHAAHSALSYNGSYSISLFLSTEVLHALLCLSLTYCTQDTVSNCLYNQVLTCFINLSMTISTRSLVSARSCSSSIFSSIIPRYQLTNSLLRRPLSSINAK